MTQPWRTGLPEMLSKVHERSGEPEGPPAPCNTMACKIASVRGTENDSSCREMLQGEDSEQCTAVGVQGRQAAAFVVRVEAHQPEACLYTDNTCSSHQMAGPHCYLQMLSQEARLASRIHCITMELMHSKSSRTLT